MKRDIVLKGRTVEEKLKSAELLFNRLSRKLGNKVIGVMPISPIFHFAYAPGDGGVIARVVFPASGVITKLAFHVDRRGKRPFKIRIDLLNDITGVEASRTVTVKHTTEIASLDIPVDAGDRALITYVPTTEEDEQVREIWFSMLYQIEPKSLRTHTFLLDELSSLIERDVNYVRGYDSEE